MGQLTLQLQQRRCHSCPWWRRGSRPSRESRQNRGRRWRERSPRCRKNDHSSAESWTAGRRRSVVKWQITIARKQCRKDKKKTKLATWKVLFACKCPYRAIGVLDNEQYGRVEALHLPVQCVQTEAVNGRTVDQRPAVPFGASRQVLWQLKGGRKRGVKKYSVLKKYRNHTLRIISAVNSSVLPLMSGKIGSLGSRPKRSAKLCSSEELEIWR